MKKKKKKNFTPLIIFLVITLVATSIFLGTYYYFIGNSYKTYEKSIKANIDKINVLNLSTSSLVNGQTINAEEAKKTLPKCIDGLSKVKNSLLDLNPTEKYKEMHNSLINGLTSNILLYKELNSTLTSSNTNIESSIESIKNYKDSCMSSYSLVYINNSTITLPEGCLNFIVSSQSYTYELARQKRDKEIVQNQNLEFINVVDVNLNKFDKLQANYSLSLKSIKDSKGNLNDLLNKLENDKYEFAKIKNDFSKISVPSKSSEVFSLFNKTLDSYSLYLQDFKYALSNESAQTSTSSLDQKVLDSLYKSSEEDYKKYLDLYDDFSKKYNEFKNSAIK